MIRYTVAIFYTLNTCHTTSSWLESQERNNNVEGQVWPEGLIYVFSIQSVFSLLTPGNKTTNRLKCTFTKSLVHGLLISPDCLRQIVFTFIRTLRALRHKPVSRDQILGLPRGQGNYNIPCSAIIIFPAQLTTSRMGNLTPLIHTLLYVMTTHTYFEHSSCKCYTLGNGQRHTWLCRHLPFLHLCSYSCARNTKI